MSGNNVIQVVVGSVFLGIGGWTIFAAFTTRFRIIWKRGLWMLAPSQILFGLLFAWGGIVTILSMNHSSAAVLTSFLLIFALRMSSLFFDRKHWPKQ
jgi:hypothetical protein